MQLVIQLQLFAPYDEKSYWGELVKWNATRFGTNYMFLDRVEEEFRSDEHLSLAVMMEAAASTATMMMRTTLEGVMMVMLEGVVGLEGVVVLDGVVVRCHPFSLLGR